MKTETELERELAAETEAKYMAIGVAADALEERDRLREVLSTIRERVYGSTFHMGGDDLIRILSNATLKMQA